MRKLLAAAVLAVMAFAACGKEGSGGKVIAAGQPGSSSAPVSSAAGGGSSSTPTPTPAAVASPAPGSSTAPSKATAAPTTSTKPAAAGEANRPKDGRYIYTLNGRGTGPFNSTPQSYSGTATQTSTHSGDNYTSESTDTVQAGRATTKTTWSSANVLLVELIIENPGGTIDCKFNPSLAIIRFPVKPETYPTQPFSGNCKGTLDIQIVKKENVVDASKHTWSAWQVKVKLNFTSGTLTVAQTGTRWVAPDLGAEVKDTSHQDIKYGTQRFFNDSTLLLKSHP